MASIAVSVVAKAVIMMTTQSRRGLLHGAQQVETAGSAHLHVGDHDVEVVRAERDERFVGARRGDHGIAFAAKEDLEELAQAALVVDHQDARGGLIAPAPAAGSRTRKRVPTPGWLSTWSAPPWLSTMRCTVGSPSPVPSALVV